MGYTIIYNKKTKGSKRSRILFITVLFFMMFMGWCFRCWDQGREAVLSVLFPGDAVPVFQYVIDSGAGIWDAVAAFCNELFSEANKAVY